jgi:plastocyanin
MSRAARRLALIAAAGALAAPVAAADAADFAVSFPSDPESGPYTPATVEAQPGDTVTFSGSFANHPLEWVYADFTEQETGTTRIYTFPKAGTYRFFCDFHADMTGTVHVAGNQLGTADFGFSPAAPAIGTKVTFEAGAVADPDGSVARYEWDLDGNGTFDVVGPARTTTKTYTKAGAYAVAVRYVDDAHETSAATTHTVMVGTPPIGGGGSTPAPGPGTGTGTGTTTPGAPTTPGTTVPKDTRAPRATLTSTRVKVKGRRASIALRLDESASATATLKRGSKTLGQATVRALAKGTATIRVTLGRRVVVRRTLTATLTLVTRDAAGNARTLKRTVLLRR